MKKLKVSYLNNRKHCPRCDKDKDISEFYIYKRAGNYYLKSWCIKCECKWQADRYREKYFKKLEMGNND
jgi:hypothetical protein